MTVERALLAVIAAVLVAILVVTVVPGPFQTCTHTGGRPYGLGAVGGTTECSRSWWPF